MTPGPALASVILAGQPASCDRHHLAWPFALPASGLTSVAGKHCHYIFVDKAGHWVYFGSDGNETERDLLLAHIARELSISEAVGKE